MNLSEPFIRRPIMTVLVMAGILIFGLTAYRLLPVSTLPNIDFPTIQVTAELPGASPETMASAVATPLEKQFSTIAGIDQMTSVSGQGTTSITIQVAVVPLATVWRYVIEIVRTGSNAQRIVMFGTPNASGNMGGNFGSVTTAAETDTSDSCGKTATCTDCDIGWQGPRAHELGLAHEKETGHAVWFDHNPGIHETGTSGPFRVELRDTNA